MERSHFYRTLKQLGEFRCVNDLRKFNNQRKRNPNYSLAMYLGHFGHCKDGEYHHCDFHLRPQPVNQVIYYYKVTEVNGAKVRQRGGKPMTSWGRGRGPRNRSK